MDDLAIEAIKSQLDSDILKIKGKFGIKFGDSLFDAFKERGWIAGEPFSFKGTGAFPVQCDAYNRNYAASRDHELDDWEYKLGQPAA